MLIKFTRPSWAVLMGVINKNTQVTSLSYVYDQAMKDVRTDERTHVTKKVRDLQYEDYPEWVHLYIILLVITNKTNPLYLTPIYERYNSIDLLQNIHYNYTVRYNIDHILSMNGRVMFLGQWELDRLKYIRQHLILELSDAVKDFVQSL